MHTIEPIWTHELGDGPLVAVALHDGHAVRDEVAEHLALGDADRLREQDPHTGDWTRVADTRIIGLNSRFEVDLNRPRVSACYRTPEDAWGLTVWKGELPETVVERSLAAYDAFYDNAREILSMIEKQHGCFVVFDLHSYNHRRGGRTASPDDPAENPQVNIGTGTMDRARWGSLVDRFIDDLRGHPFPGGALDVRENVKFQGGQFSRWVHETFPHTGCSIAIEFKKFFMDEWTGAPDVTIVSAIPDALRATVTGVLEELKRI